MLSGKKIILGITGSIAAYKSLQILRDLRAAGAEVDVVLTKAARHFVPLTTLQVFSGRPVLSDLFEPNHEMAHLSLAQNADLVLIAPVTAHFISKMASGLNDDLLSSLLLSTPAPVMIAPAMDIGMWAHPAVQENVDRLKNRGVRVIGPEIGPLASGKVGMGRFADEQKIVSEVCSFFTKDQPSMSGEVVLVTAGPTEEPIDPVRFISNRSSGKMGYAVAEVAKKWGARVILVSGPTALPAPEGVERLSVRTADEMNGAVAQSISEASIVVMAAAVSDYRPSALLPEKIKKTGSNYVIELEETHDILGGRPKGLPAQIVVGFAAETKNLLENAKKKLEQKQLDLIVANDVTQEGAGFDVDTNIVHFITSKGDVTAYPKMSKHRVASRLLKQVLMLKSAFS